MKLLDRVLVLSVLAPVLAPSSAGTSSSQTPSPPPRSLRSETPARFEAVTDSFDYVKRDVMIPMRDGVKLHASFVELPLVVTP